MKTIRQNVSRFLHFFVALFIAAGCAAVLLQAPAGEAQPIGRDKYQHAAGSALLGAVARSQEPDPLKAWALAMVPGVIKELSDSRPGGTGFSVKDMAANAVGAYIGVKVGGLIFTRNRVTYTKTF